MLITANDYFHQALKGIQVHVFISPDGSQVREREISMECRGFDPDTGIVILSVRDPDTGQLMISPGGQFLERTEIGHIRTIPPVAEILRLLGRTK